MAGEYTINFTNGSDPLKTSFVIQPNEIDGPGNTNVNTILQLHGRFIVNYGELVAENLVHLLENFSSDTAPTVTTSGMLWFDTTGGNSGEGVLKVRSTQDDQWIEVGATDASTGGAGGKFQDGGNSSFTAVSGGNYFVDTSSSTVTVTLPASPAIGDVVGIVDVAGTFDTNSCFVDGNGELIMSDPSQMEVSVEFARVKLGYSGATYGWRIIA